MKTLAGIFILAALFGLFGLSAPTARAAGMETFLGTWVVDYGKTMEEAKKSPKYSPKDDARFAAAIQRMMATMKIQFTGDEMIYLRGDRKNAVPYTLKSSDGTKAAISCAAGGRHFDVVLTLRKGDTMNFKSSGSDDMDFYVWKRGK